MCACELCLNFMKCCWYTFGRLSSVSSGITTCWVPFLLGLVFFWTIDVLFSFVWCWDSSLVIGISSGAAILVVARGNVISALWNGEVKTEVFNLWRKWSFLQTPTSPHLRGRWTLASLFSPSQLPGDLWELSLGEKSLGPSALKVPNHYPSSLTIIFRSPMSSANCMWIGAQDLAGNLLPSVPAANWGRSSRSCWFRRRGGSCMPLSQIPPSCGSLKKPRMILHKNSKGNGNRILSKINIKKMYVHISDTSLPLRIRGRHSS